MALHALANLRRAPLHSPIKVLDKALKELLDMPVAGRAPHAYSSKRLEIIAGELLKSGTDHAIQPDLDGRPAVEAEEAADLRALEDHGCFSNEKKKKREL